MGDAVAAVVCTAPTCTNRGHHVQVHSDTPLPIHCGGCFAVLYCEHQFEDVVVTKGTYAAPVRVTSSTCTVCGLSTELSREPLPAVDVLSLPFGSVHG